ncbi:probable disease resistance protein At4g27220 [Neltuma alba]|uniref:probable disease resistance protein At4g27220 n=1 Tax=Neltuma alba TaxID=207710 RepID=UPI0010A4CD7F|nr:probable disease resistance protein At4g27220 [Prosopis alba]
MEPLDTLDSWALFEKFLGSHEELSLEVKGIAYKVAEECDGLPLAIVRIATSMKGKTQAREWSNMLECLGNLGNGQYQMDKWVFSVSRSSYDFLTNKLQRFFLYCALSTNGNFYGDATYHFIRRFVYESIDETEKLRVQYVKGRNMLYKLKNHSMLHNIRLGGRWMMDKFLRVLAIGIAEETGKIMRKAYEDLTEIPSDDQWKEDLQKNFLTGNEIQTIPDSTYPRCSQLSTLLLNHNAKLNYISNDFFNNMPTLKTLDLSNTGIKRLPRSVSSLECLTTLLLSRCRKLSFIPSLRKLKRLISLDLFFTAITEAPVGLESLVNLSSTVLSLFAATPLVLLRNVERKKMQLTVAMEARAEATEQRSSPSLVTTSSGPVHAALLWFWTLVLPSLCFLPLSAAIRVCHQEEAVEKKEEQMLSVEDEDSGERKCDCRETLVLRSLFLAAGLHRR